MSKLFSRFGRSNSGCKSAEQLQADTMASIQQLDDQIKALDKKRAQVEGKVKGLKEEAGKLARAKKKKQALQKLKLAKQHETRLDRLMNQMFNLETQKMNLDEAASHSNVMKAMSGAAKSLKEHAGEQALEAAEVIREDIDEQMENFEEMNRIMNQPLTCGDGIDEDELERELAELDQEDMLDDPNSEFYMYKQATPATTQKIESKQQDDVDDVDDVDMGTQPILSKEEEKELAMLEREDNLLLNSANDHVEAEVQGERVEKRKVEALRVTNGNGVKQANNFVSPHKHRIALTV